MYLFALELCPLVKRMENTGVLVTDSENDISRWTKNNASVRKSL